MTSEYKGETQDFMLSSTYRIRVGCGNLYVIICYDEKRRFKRLFIPRNSKFYCPLTTRDAIAKLATFGSKRNLRQTIKDLRGERPLVDGKGHYCEKYNIKAEATSCFDAVSKVLSKWQTRKRSEARKKKKK